jgi:long-chain fatty acid transport protein
MQRVVKVLVILCCTMMLPGVALATNGDNLLAIGPIARAMGGVGIAAPQDAISAVFANPAAMCFGPYCPSTEVNFSGTLFMPHVDAKVTAGNRTFEASSDEKVYAIPAIGLSIPITSGPPFWRFGLAAFGVSGLGVDYRDTAIERPNFFGPGAPLVAGEFTQLQIMKFAPAIAFQPTDQLSFGLAVHVDYSSLDLRDGSSFNYGIGAQVGMIYKITDQISFGLSYVTPQNVEHENVRDFDGDGNSDKLELEAPHQVGAGIAYKPFGDKLLLETDVKWLDWADANGYGDFDWESQVVVSVGAQYKPIPNLALRVGYNYANNPVQEHDGFNGVFGRFTDLQGKKVPTYYFETFRIIGFPAVVEHHVTAGIGYDITPKVGLNLGYTHGFEKTIRETGTNIIGQRATLESSLSEDSVDFGLTWRF